MIGNIGNALLFITSFNEVNKCYQVIEQNEKYYNHSKQHGNVEPTMVINYLFYMKYIFLNLMKFKIMQQLEIKSNYSLEIIKGEDNTGIKFTAFVLLDSKNDIKIEKGCVIDLTSLNVIYKIPGHAVYKEDIDGVKEYTKKYYIPKLEAKKKRALLKIEAKHHSEQ